MGGSYLGTAAGILAVEAYHAGLIRTTINILDPLNAAGFQTLTQKISTLRAALSLQANAKASNPDDYGLATASVSLGGGGNVTRTSIVDADANVIAFSRSTTQVLNIVTGGGATATGTAKGVFFPNGLNGLFS